MTEDTVFHKIIRKELPSDMVYEDERVVVFRDINPVAPTHLLCVPKVYIEDLSKADEEHTEILGHLLYVAQKVAAEEGISESGFRTVINCGSDSGMEVPYLHVHVIGGKKLGAIA